MIEEINDDIIYDGLPDYSVLLVQVNCMGEMMGGFMQRVARKWEEWFPQYHQQCGWFQDGHQHELMDSFYAFNASDKLIIASAFAQLEMQKRTQATDYSAWQKILHKIERQVSRQIQATGVQWSVHMQCGTGCGGNGGGDWNRMLEMIQYNFKDSNVRFVIHGTMR